MKQLKVIFLKDLKGIFRSPILYLILAFYLFLLGLLFSHYLSELSLVNSLTLTYAVYRPLLGNMNFLLLFLLPLLGMNSFSLELRQGTFSWYKRAKVSPHILLLSKSLALSVVMGCFLIISSFFPLFLVWMGMNDWGILWVSLQGLFLNALCYTLMGVFISGLSRSPFLVGPLSLGVSFFFLILLILANNVNLPEWGQFIRYLSLAFYFEFFTRGLWGSIPFVYFISLCLFLYVLSYGNLQNRLKF